VFLHSSIPCPPERSLHIGSICFASVFDIFYQNAAKWFEADHHPCVNIRWSPSVKMLRTTTANLIRHRSRILDFNTASPLHHSHGFNSFISKHFEGHAVLRQAATSGICQYGQLPSWPHSTFYLCCHRSSENFDRLTYVLVQVSRRCSHSGTIFPFSSSAFTSLGCDLKPLHYYELVFWSHVVTFSDFFPCVLRPES
jgi:hypothetical protein